MAAAFFSGEMKGLIAHVSGSPKLRPWIPTPFQAGAGITVQSPCIVPAYSRSPNFFIKTLPAIMNPALPLANTSGASGHLYSTDSLDVPPFTHRSVISPHTSGSTMTFPSFRIFTSFAYWIMAQSRYTESGSPIEVTIPT